uniref:Uncharacterized protein n=1 Tax=Anguilla anguilla TaxID=7936 RepID=A0A0E9V1N1_ANGAN
MCVSHFQGLLSRLCRVQHGFADGSPED